MVSNMLLSVILAAAASAPLVAAHGKIPVCVGDQGGNGTGMGIQGGIVPGTGNNGQTEVDTTTFQNTNVKTDGLGKCTADGKFTLAQFPVYSTLMHDLSGPTLPQVSNGDGSLNCVWHQVVDDGTGPINCVVDPTGTGAYSQGTLMTMVVQVPANGNGKVQNNGRRWNPLGRRADTNVDAVFPFTAKLTAPVTCTGTFGNDTNVCLMKCANLVNNGPWGGNVPFQIGTGAAGTGSTTSGAASPSTSPAGNVNAVKSKGENQKNAKATSAAAATTPPAPAVPTAPAPAAPTPPADVAPVTVTVTTTVTSTVTEPWYVNTGAPAVLDPPITSTYDPYSPGPTTAAAYGAADDGNSGGVVPGDLPSRF